jgi:hypothetical protein
VPPIFCEAARRCNAGPPPAVGRHADRSRQAAPPGGNPLYTRYPPGTVFDPYEHFSWVNACAHDAMREWLFQHAKP